MTTAGYIISFTIPQGNIEAAMIAQKIAANGQIFFGISNETVSNNLLAVPVGKKSAQELKTQLEAIPAIQKVSVVTVSEPVKQTELSDLRNLLSDLDMDASNVSNEQLSLFVVSKMQGEYTCYIDSEIKRNEKGLHNIRIKRLEEHLQFSPDWLKPPVSKKREGQDSEQAFDDIEYGSVTIERVEEEEPSPPPPPLNNLHKMTNDEIRCWIKENHLPNLEDQQIEIKRSSQEIMITIRQDEITETIQYKIKK